MNAFQGKGEMLTYFLEGEDECQRQRRISHAHVKRSLSSPNGDIWADENIFGAPIIDKKYWPNGTVTAASVPMIETVRESSATNEDETVISRQSDCCDTNNYVNLRDKMFKTNTQNTGNLTKLKNSGVSMSDDIILSDTNPFKMAAPSSQRHCLSESGCETEVLLGERNCEESLASPWRKRAELKRMASLPVPIAEDRV